MKDSNRQRLENNIGDNHRNLRDYLSNEQVVAKKTIKLTPVQATDNLQEKFSQNIEDLTRLRDERMGIVWTIYLDHDDGSEHVIRDARSVQYDEKKGIPPTHGIESYFIQQLNIGRSALYILDKQLEDKVGDLQLLQARAKLIDFLNTNINQMQERLATEKNFDDPSLKQATLNFNKTILDILESAEIEDVAKKLNITKDQIIINNTHRHFSTLTKLHNGQTLIETDTLLLGITEDQEKMFQAIKAGSDKYDWYNKQSPYQKKLTLEFIDKVLAGKPLRLSSQMVNILPTLRNAALTSTMLWDGNDIEVLSEHSHSGVPAYVGKGDQKAITQQNINQLKSFMPAGAIVNDVMLISSGDRLSDEHDMADLLHGSEGITVTSTPFNQFRLWEILKQKVIRKKGEYAPYLAALKVIGEKEGGAIGEYLQGEIKYSTTVEAELIVIDEDKAKALRCAVESKQLIEKPSFGFDWDNNANLQINDLMNEVENAVHIKKLFPGLDKLIPRSHFHCKSGRDRAGINRFYNSFKSVMRKFNIVEESTEYLKNLQSQTVGGHTQFSADIYTGTPGIKESSVFAFPKFIKNNIKGLWQKTASMNKFQYNKKYQTPEIIESPKEKSPEKTIEAPDYRQAETLKEFKDAISMSVEKEELVACKLVNEKKDDYIKRYTFHSALNPDDRGCDITYIKDTSKIPASISFEIGKNFSGVIEPQKLGPGVYSKGFEVENGVIKDLPVNKDQNYKFKPATVKIGAPGKQVRPRQSTEVVSHKQDSPSH